MKQKIFLITCLNTRLGGKARVIAVLEPVETTESTLKQSLTDQGFEVLQIKQITPEPGNALLEEALNKLNQILITLTPADLEAIHLIISEVAGQGSLLGAKYVEDTLKNRTRPN